MDEVISTALIRQVRADDAEWVRGLVPRLHEFGPPSWRSVEQMNEAECADLTRALSSLPNDSTAFLLAERPDNHQRVGFVYVAIAVDFFTGEQHAHIKDLVVAKEGEGHGIARQLLAAAEEWAKAKGYRVITLSVFPRNERARDLYQSVGYDTDVLRMLKVLG